MAIVGDSAARVVADAMIRMPKVLPPDALVSEVRALFTDDHVVMVLLTRGGVLLGTLERDDLPGCAPPSGQALPFSRLTGRVVSPTASVDAAHARLLEEGRRRLAVVDADGMLRGLLCLKRRRTTFCTDAGVAARARGAGVTPASTTLATS